MDVPKWIEDIFYTYFITEVTYADGDIPTTIPVSTFYDREKGSITFTTTPALYQKVRCIKQNTKVSLLYSNPEHSRTDSKSFVLVKGDAVVHEEDLEENDRVMRDLMRIQQDSRKKEVFANLMKEIDSPIGRLLMDWYMIRLLIEVTPRVIMAWLDGDMDKEPEVFEVN